MRMITRKQEGALDLSAINSRADDTTAQFVLSASNFFACFYAPWIGIYFVTRAFNDATRRLRRNDAGVGVQADDAEC